MADYLKEYKVTLHTIGPVFIGSGKELSKKEYVISGGKIGVIDLPKLFGFLQRKGLQSKFEAFFLNENRMDLYGWLRENSLRPADISGCMKYEIDAGDTAIIRGTRIQVMEFVKDAYGLPYVPGSSIKGMLRTILLSDAILRDTDLQSFGGSAISSALQQGCRNRNIFLNREQKQIEVKVFNNLNRHDKTSDAVNDCMSGMRISDSFPLELSDLVLCQKIEYHKDGTEKTLNMLRECIRPGIDISFNITVDEKLFNITPDRIMEAVKNFNSNYDETFRLHFKNGGRSTADSVYLGGGAGFVSKTDIYPVYGRQKGVEITADIFRQTKVPGNHKHNLDKSLGVSPHILKMTRYKGKLYHMGECSWHFR